MEPPPPDMRPQRVRRAPCPRPEGPLGWYAAADAYRLPAVSDEAIIAWTRTQERLERAREALSRSTELIAHSGDALARSATLLSGGAGKGPASAA